MKERIRQLEANTKALTQNLKLQADRHISELTTLTKQIQIHFSSFLFFCFVLFCSFVNLFEIRK